MEKSQVRKEITEKIKAQSPDEKDKKDKIIAKKLLKLKEFEKAKVIAFYVSLKSEVDTIALIDNALTKGKRVVVPVITGNDLSLSEIRSRKQDLKKGPCGILQPMQNKKKAFPKEGIDMIIVPGIAFTKKGARLGRGKGFYDKFLKNMPDRIKKIGLAYDIQIIKGLPVTPRDIPVDIVITN